MTAQSSSLNEIDERSGSRCYHKVPWTLSRKLAILTFFPIYAVCDGERGEASAQLLKTLHKGLVKVALPGCQELSCCSCKILLFQVDDTKCKTVFKNAFTTQMETQVSRGGLIGRELLVRPNL